MPARPLVRRLSMGVTALLVGGGLAALAAAPAHAVTVNDTASLNAAILANEPVLELTADITLDADLADIAYDVEIIGNGHTIDAAGFDAFDIAASATITSLTIVDAANHAIDLDLVAGDIATLTGVSTRGAGQAGLDAVLVGDARLQITGGSHEDESTGVYVSAEGTSSATIDGVAVTDAFFGFDLYAVDDATIAVSGITVTAGPNYNSSRTGRGMHLYTADAGSVAVDGATITGAADQTAVGFDYGVEAYSHQSGAIAIANAATVGGYEGFYVDVEHPEGAFSLSDSSVTGAAAYGVVLARLAGTGVIANTAITGNGVEANAAGLLLTNGGGTPLTISNSVVAGNSGSGIAGENEGAGTTLAITGSTIADNGDIGIAVDSYDGAALTVDSSTVSGNAGGGIWPGLYQTSSATIVNSTVSGNTGGWAVRIHGHDTASASLRHSTVTDNTGEAAVSVEELTATISHSIVAGNHITGSSAELYLSAATVDTEWSLIGTVFEESGGIYTEGAGVRSGVTDPGLEPLADNGGPTRTHLISPMGIALNAGNPAIAGAPSADQRGSARIVGDAIDIGAVEVTPTLPATGADTEAAGGLGALLLLLGGLLVGSRVLRRRAAA